MRDTHLKLFQRPREWYALRTDRKSSFPKKSASTDDVTPWPLCTFSMSFSTISQQTHAKTPQFIKYEIEEHNLHK